jgi:hypothetical protein
VETEGDAKAPLSRKNPKMPMAIHPMKKKSGTLMNTRETQLRFFFASLMASWFFFEVLHRADKPLSALIKAGGIRV